MNVDLTGYKVIYKDRVLRALALIDTWLTRKEDDTTVIEKLTVLYINEAGVIDVLVGEPKEFQFIPIIV